MSNAVFAASQETGYDDLLEERYHFPKQYLKNVEAALHDWIVYYEPRRAGGRQVYFALAYIDRIEPDPNLADHYFAYLKSYFELDNPVPFKVGDHYFESALKREDGSTRTGAFRSSVRLLPQAEFELIKQAGFDRPLDQWEQPLQVAEDVAEYVVHPLVQMVVSKKLRDRAFTRHVRTAYANTCAVTGLRLINGGGRPEVQAAHIRPVEFDGPDSVRNGIALTGTVHWLFDRGLISFTNDLQLLKAKKELEAEFGTTFLNPKLSWPTNADVRPHPTYLSWHRSNCFKG
jgi:putative restriction endonuclease